MVVAIFIVGKLLLTLVMFISSTEVILINALQKVATKSRLTAGTVSGREWVLGREVG